MELYLTEKPKVGRALAKILGANDRHEGYATDGGQIYVTWAVGHLLEVFEPAEYDEKWKRWDLDHLPIVPEAFQQKVKPKLSKQYQVVEKLLKKATSVYIATDIDREGESIARELMDRAGYWGDVYRVPIASLDLSSIRDAIKAIQPGESTFNLYMSAIGRTRADWLIGMNFSRLASLTAQAAGSRESLPVGRVLTAIVALVANHDRRRKDFIPHDYFTIDIDAAFAGGNVRAAWKPPKAKSDDNGRCVDEAYAKELSSRLNGQQAVVSLLKIRESSEKAPLPFDMTTLQQYCANRWGYDASKTLKAAQELYETHTVITYPRSDCKFLPDSQFPQVPAILKALVEGDPELESRVGLANTTKKPAAYNTEKVGAHHAIIPTTKAVAYKSLPETERNVFDAVRLRFLANFCAPFKSEKTRVELTCVEHTFLASGSVPIDQGWKAIYNGDADAAEPKDDDGEEDEGVGTATLPQLTEGESGKVDGVQPRTKQTQAPKPFTVSTLLGAMNNVSRFVDEPELKKILDEKDGIGTQGTRAAILDNAFRYNYLKHSKKQIVATEKAYGMLKIVPPAIASPGMTAGWEKQLDKIARGEITLEEFEAKIERWLRALVAQGVVNVQNNELGATKADFGDSGVDDSAYPCLSCGGAMRRIKGGYGFFWGCQDRDKCGATFPDVKGKPQKREKQPDTVPDCPDCGKPMRLRQGGKSKGKGKGKSKPSSFWGCSGYPDCKKTMPCES
jgi:DNA topoisomerase-3